MKPKFVLPLAAAVCLPLAYSARADTYTETGDAGDVPAYSQFVIGVANTPLTSISGQTTLTNGMSDGDMYLIYISDPAAFSAALTSFVPGANNFDSQLALFNSQGQGVETNDDDVATNSAQSALPTGNALLSAQGVGMYYLLVNGSGRYAIDGNNNLIFPNYNDGVTDPSSTVGPNTGVSSLADYIGSSNEAGSYVITLTGAQVVPEPSPGWFVLAGAAGLGVLQRARRRVAR